MPDSAADVIADALTHHRPITIPRHTTTPSTCHCGATNLHMGDRWEAHLADVTVAALTQSGHLSTHPVKRDYTAEATWRAAALNIVAAAHTTHLPHTDAAHIQLAILNTFWPSMATAINRLIKAKADLLKEHP